MRHNIDAWWPLIAGDDGPPVEAILVSASGCGAMVKEYGHLLANDGAYADKATRVAAGDASWLEVLRAGQLVALAQADERVRAALLAATERRMQPSGDERDLPGDIAREVARSSALTLTWMKAIEDGVLNRRELTDIIVAAEGLRETCDSIMRDARAQQLRRPA
jgi:hypothetical protein